MAPPNVKIEHGQDLTGAPDRRLRLSTCSRANFVSPEGGPSAIALVGGDMSLLPSLAGALLRALLLTPGVGDAFTARNENGELVGYAVFSLPGQLLLSTEEQKVHGFLDFIAQLSPEGRRYYTETMSIDVPKANDEILGIHDAERNTYWCHFTMVRADYQGKGIARALFELATQEAAKAGAIMALTTTNIRNVEIYQKLGFKLYGHKVMPSPWADWSTWYLAKAAANTADCGEQKCFDIVVQRLPFAECVR